MEDHVALLLCVASVASLCIGVTIGHGVAQKSAVLRSDCSGPHHMLGGFYYIVPESRYLRMRETETPHRVDTRYPGARIDPNLSLDHQNLPNV